MLVHQSIVWLAWKYSKVVVHGGNKYVPGKIWSQQKAVNMRKAILSPAKSSFHKWRNEVEFAAATGLHVMSTFTS